MTKAEYIFGICYLVAQQFLIPYLLVLGAVWLRLPIDELWLNFTFFVLNIVVICIGFSRYLGQNLRHLGKHILQILSTSVVGFVVYWASNLLVSIAIFLYFPSFSNANDASIQAMASQQYWIMFTGSVILVPVVEEVLYRGVIFSFLDRYSRPLAYLLSALFFAAIHVVGYIGSMEPMYLLVSVLQYLPAGLCLCWAYARTGNIFAPVLIHTAVNLMGMLAMR